ncbi:MAG: hypothetical protein J2P24_02645, partial [Streptosporangiales bacterium]|nr:hypothetical protein [Streptosporangiales bacterium]
MTQHEAAEEPRAAAPPPVFRFNGYGVPVDDAGAAEAGPEPDPTSPYSYDAYGPAVDPYVENLPYDQPVAAYSYGAPVEPPVHPEPEPERAPVTWSGPIAVPPAEPEPEPEPEPAVAETPWRPEVPAARSEPGPPPPEPGPRPVPVGSVPAYADQPYVHAYVAADAFAEPADTAWPARPRTEQPAVVARQAYRPPRRAADRAAAEKR